MHLEHLFQSQKIHCDVVALSIDWHIDNGSYDDIAETEVYE